MKINHFSYDVSDNNSLIHKRRDGDAFTELLALYLSNQENDYAELIMNHPHHLIKNHKTLPQKFSSEDIIVLTTRPPISDEEASKTSLKVEKKSRRRFGLQYCTRSIEKSRTPLETYIINRLEEAMPICTRKQINFSDHIKNKLIKEDKLQGENKRGYKSDFSISVKGDPRYSHFGLFNENGGHEAKTPDTTKTPGFLINLPGKAGNPRILACFGLSGTATLIFSRWIRLNYKAEDLMNDRFLFVDFPIECHNFQYSPDLSFVKTLEPEILLDIKDPIP